MITRRTLNQKETFALLKFMEESFTASKLEDAPYAEMARKALGIEGLNANHIWNARKTLGLESHARRGKGDTRVKELEEMVLAMSIRMDDIVRKVEMLQRDFHLHPPGASPALRRPS